MDFQSAFATAVDSMFSTPAAPAPAPTAPATPAAEAPSSDAAPAATTAPESTPAAEPAKPAEQPAAPAKTATDYALELAKVRTKEKALADDKVKAAKDTASQADALKRLAEIEAARDNPLELLKLFKHDYKRVTDDFVKQLEADPAAVDPVLKKLAELETKLAAREAKDQSDREAVFVQNWVGDVRKAVEANQDQYEYVAKYGKEGLDFVLKLADDHANNTGEVLSAKEALDIAEEAYARHAAIAAQTKKLQSKLAPPPAKPAPEPEPSLSARHESHVTQAEKPKPKKSMADIVSAVIDEHFG